MRTTEILVIGGGVIGSSIAYHLARRGRRVLVVDRAQLSAEPSASWASAGGIRRQGRHRAEVSLAIEASARWPTLSDELGTDLHYRQNGNLLLAESDIEADKLATFVSSQQKKGFTDVRLIDRIEARELVPGLASHIVAGSYSPADGQADSATTAHAFASASQRHGASYLVATRADALVTDGSRVIGALMAGDRIDAEHIVLATGAWSTQLALAVGLDFPIKVEALQMVRSTATPLDSHIPVLSAMRRTLSLKQTHRGAFLLGGGWPGDVTDDGNDYALRTSSIESNWSEACAILPAVATRRIDRAWCGLEAMSADRIPFVGIVPTMGGLSVAFGFSGHGFALAPAIGRALADRLEAKSVPELEGLRPDRKVDGLA